MKFNSYHIFSFPFKWEISEIKKQSFKNRFDLEKIKSIKKNNSSWENLPVPKTESYKVELYNEKNYFYDFVHPVLYDTGDENPIVLHFERQEAYSSNLKYNIKVIADSTNLYELNLKSIGLNFYSTGVGVITFYIENHQSDIFQDILRINQFGRRILPPFLSAENGITFTKYAELADYISITGLKGNPDRYFEDFETYTPNDTWKPARFIESLINDFSTDLKIEPVTDDRMHVASWFGDDMLSKTIQETQNDFSEDFLNDWYRYIFIDAGKKPMCENKKMLKELVQNSTYMRWQESGSLHGITRYSHTYLTNKTVPEHLITTFRTMHARMIELSLVQRASILKFSEEVTRLSRLKKNQDLISDINELYREYIRFVNQISFREITAQEQGIEIYTKLQEKMKIQDQVKNLDNEIEELHQYALLAEDREQNKNLHILTIIGALFIIPSFITGFFGMNVFSENAKTAATLAIGTNMGIYLGFGILILPALVILFIKTKNKFLKTLLPFLIFILFLIVLILPILTKLY